MSYCEFSDLPTEMCAHCLGYQDKPETRVHADAWTTAKHGSRCPGCEGTIREGDRIGLADQFWLCEGCFA